MQIVVDELHLLLRISDVLIRSISYNMARSDVSDLQSPIPRARAPEGEVTVNQIHHELAML